MIRNRKVNKDPEILEKSHEKIQDKVQDGADKVEWWLFSLSKKLKRLDHKIRNWVKKQSK